MSLGSTRSPRVHAVSTRSETAESPDATCARGELNQRDLTLIPAKIAVLSVESAPVASR